MSEMTKDRIIEIARECGVFITGPDYQHPENNYECWESDLLKFAARIRNEALDEAADYVGGPVMGATEECNKALKYTAVGLRGMKTKEG